MGFFFGLIWFAVMLWLVDRRLDWTASARTGR